MSKLTNFQYKLQNGEIKDFRSYLTVKPASIQVEMAKHGILVDELVEQNNPTVIAELIRNGYAQEHYNKWRILGNKEVRRALASVGYASDELIKDSTWEVRMEVIDHNPAYAKYVTSTVNYHEFDRVVKTLSKQVDVDFDTIDALLKNQLIETRKQDGFLMSDVAALKLKYATRDIEVSVMEKTMTTWQLFMSHSRAWMVQATGSALYEISKCEDDLRESKREDLFYDVLKDNASSRYVKFKIETDK